jgi:hypothetical protein
MSRRSSFGLPRFAGFRLIAPSWFTQLRRPSPARFFRSRAIMIFSRLSRG